jgi:hypothetical protein
MSDVTMFKVLSARKSSMEERLLHGFCAGQRGEAGRWTGLTRFKLSRGDGLAFGAAAQRSIEPMSQNIHERHTHEKY